MSIVPLKTDGRNVYRILHSCSFRTHCIWLSKTICHVQHEMWSVLIFVHPTLLVSDCTLTKTKVYIYPKQAVRRTRKKKSFKLCQLAVLFFDNMSKGTIFNNFVSGALLVSTYVVCDRLSVMHESAGVVEILVQILTEYPLFWSTVSEYPPTPKMKIVRVQIREFQNTAPPQKWKLSESPNPRVSEYPPHKNENCQRVQIREFQNTPPNENCQRVQIREFQNTPPNWKLSESPNLRVSEYPPPPQIGKTSDLKLQNSLKIREIYVETNL